MLFTYHRFPDVNFVPGENSDGKQNLEGYNEYNYCIFDTSALDKDEYDETVSVSWGGEAKFKNCLFTGGYKLCLIGSGDEDKRSVEEGKNVEFHNCIFSTFGRRGPEVQAGMEVAMYNCLVANWGDPDYFDTRAFGAWAHHGGSIYCENCVFIPYSKSIPLSLRLKDKMNWIGQSYNYDGIASLVRKNTYRSGWSRALFNSNGGVAVAENCYFGEGAWTNAIIKEGSMSYDNAMELVSNLWDMVSIIKNGRGEPCE